MKKRLIILGVLISITIIHLFLCLKFPLRIKFDVDYSQKNNCSISIYNDIVKSDLNIRNEKEIKKVIKLMNSIRYSDGSDLNIGGETSDASLAIYDEDNNKLDSISFYGEIAIYNNKQYKIFILDYEKFNKLCKKLDKKSSK